MLSPIFLWAACGVLSPALVPRLPPAEAIVRPATACSGGKDSTRSLQRAQGAAADRLVGRSAFTWQRGRVGSICLSATNRGETSRDLFEVTVDLGDGYGVVQQQIEPYFTRSQLVIVSYPIPFTLEAVPSRGVFKVDKSGYGLMVGDILRAFSTFQLRYDSVTKGMRFCAGIPGRAKEVGAAPPPRGSIDRDATGRGPWLLRQLGLDRINPETIPGKCLFLTDGIPYQQVIDALVANTPDKTREIVMIFERPLDSP